MGDTHHDPTDHFRTTHSRAGITIKDNFLWPGVVLLGVAFFGVVCTVAVAAYRHDEWFVTTVLITVFAAVAAALWFVVEIRHVTLIDERWAQAHGTTEAVKGAVEGLKGKAKEVADVITGRDDLKDDGPAEQNDADRQARSR